MPLAVRSWISGSAGVATAEEIASRQAKRFFWSRGRAVVRLRARSSARGISKRMGGGGCGFFKGNGKCWRRKLQLVVADGFEGGGFLVFCDATFEEVLLLLDVHHLGEPREGVLDAGVEGFEFAVDQAAVADVVDVLLKFLRAETDGVDRKAVADEFLFEVDGSSHQAAQFLLEFGRPDLGVFLHQVHDQVAEDLNVVGFVAQGVAEHLADAGEFVLAIEREHHAEEAVKLRALHALAEEEHVFGELLFFAQLGEIHVAAEGAGVADHEVGFLFDGRDVFEHRLALVGIHAEGGDHVNERVGVDVFLVGMAAQEELKLGRGDQLAGDVLDVVADNSLGGGEITQRHLDDPSVNIGDRPGGIAPLLAVLLHRDVLGFPVIGLHGLVEIVGPLVF